jgi:rubrerythrin
MKKLKLDTPKEIETGRIEKGSNSNQSFTYDYTQFNSWNTWKSDWKILPNSQKPVVIEDIKVFCTECGTKRKKDSHKFCPICGTKF